MCRIFGYFGWNEPSILATAAAAAQTRHGGPDESSIFARDHWCLGVNRLAVEDLLGGRQPYVVDDNVFCVFNGEIFNHIELRRELAASGHQVRSHCDGAVLPHLYLRYGANFVDRLEGMFAFALVDLRAEPLLMLATDHLGIKPLYLSEFGGRVAFASELRGLRPLVGKLSIQSRRIDSYLERQSILGPNTIFADVKQLRPATFRLGPLGSELKEFQYRPKVYDETEVGADVPTELSNILKSECRRMVRSDSTICSIVSGGLDSSLLTGLAFQSGVSASFKAFHVTCKGGWSKDERSFAKIACESFGIDLDFVEVDPDTCHDRVPDLVAHLGQPNSGAHALSMFLLYEEIARQGYKSVLAGEGADEMFGGYNRFVDSANDPDPDWLLTYSDHLSAIPSAARSALYSDDYRAFIKEEGDASHKAFEELRHVAPEQRLLALLQYDQTERFPYYILNRTDHTSAAFGLEVRVPFCQPSVTAYSRILPARWSASHSKPKPALFAAAAKHLPESILQRPKQPFTFPVSEMFDSSIHFSDFLCDRAAGSAILRSGCFDPRSLDRLIDDARSGGTPSFRTHLWALAILDIWLEQQQTLA